MNFDSVIDSIIAREGAAFTNHAADRGGPTKYGITLATLRRTCDPNASEDDVRSLSEHMARTIYAREYIDAPGFGAVGMLSLRIAHELIDSGVNLGPDVATCWLQKALNCALDPDPDLVVDCVCGPKTLDALASYLASRARAEDIMLAMLNSQQGTQYLRLASDDRSQRVFVNGWFLQRVVPGLAEMAA